MMPIRLSLRRGKRGALLAVALFLLLCAGGVRLWLNIRGRAQQALSGVRPATVSYPVHAGPREALHGPQDGVAALTSTVDVLDGLWQEGTIYTATSGGLLRWDAPDRTPHLFTHLSGLSSASLRAVAPARGGLAVGDAQGGLTLLTGERVQRIGFRLPRVESGPVLDLLSQGDVLYVLIQDEGLLAFDGEQAVDVGRSTGVDLSQASAMCLSPEGLVIGTADGRLVRENSGKLVPLSPAPLPERITALSCQGADVYAGTPLGLYVLPLKGPAMGSPPSPARGDLLVTGLWDDGRGEVAVATFDDGVYRLRRDAAGRLRERGHQLMRQRIHRLRQAQPGALLAFGPGGPYLLPETASATALPPPPTGLSGPHVTALSRDAAGRLWVGTFEHGIDLVDLRLRPSSGLAVSEHRPQRPDPGGDGVNALLFRQATQEMWVATVRGIDRYGMADGSPRHLGGADGLIGDQVQALAETPAGLAAATQRGLTLLPDRLGAAAHSLYAFHGLLANRLYALMSLGPSLYAGTLAGLSVVRDDRVVKNYGAGGGPGLLPAGWVTALCACGEQVFAGTYGGGVAALPYGGGEAGAPRRLPLFGHRHAHVNPGALLCDGDIVWIGTLEAGLLGYNWRAGRGVRLDPALLPSRSVTALYATGEELLVGTEAGLLWLSRDRLKAALSPLDSAREDAP